VRENEHMLVILGWSDRVCLTEVVLSDCPAQEGLYSLKNMALTVIIEDKRVVEDIVSDIDQKGPSRYEYPGVLTSEIVFVSKRFISYTTNIGIRNRTK
jgi:hypothetical protein